MNKENIRPIITKQFKKSVLQLLCYQSYQPINYKFGTPHLNHGFNFNYS